MIIRVDFVKAGAQLAKEKDFSSFGSLGQSLTEFSQSGDNSEGFDQSKIVDSGIRPIEFYPEVA